MAMTPAQREKADDIIRKVLEKSAIKVVTTEVATDSSHYGIWTWLFWLFASSWLWGPVLYVMLKGN